MLEGRTVLVVEDNEQNLEMVEFLLEEAGARVVAAADAEAARRAFASEPFDLVLMDMNLPDADGLDRVAELRRNGRAAAVPVVALTALAMRGDRERFLSAGCQGYISKPIDVARFVGEVAGYLGGPPAKGTP